MSDPNWERKKEENRKAIYATVKNYDVNLYEQAVCIGHLALEEFVPDRQKAAAEVETACMYLICKCLGLDHTSKL